MMVVESRMSASRSWKRSSARSSAVSRIWPCAVRTRASGTIRLSSFSIAGSDSIRLWTKYTCPSRSSSCRTASAIRFGSKESTCVWIAIRSRGGVSITDMSRIPDSDMFSVRGIGVAVIAR